MTRDEIPVGRAPLRAFAAAAALAMALAACQQAPAPPAATPAPAAAAKAPPPVAKAPAVAAPPATPARIALPSTDFPPGPLYFCVIGASRSPIDYEPRVEQLCRRHPEMGPCQYERNVCRTNHGRVYTAKNEEVTMAVEAEYDRVVTRVRFQGDSGAPPAKKK